MILVVGAGGLVGGLVTRRLLREGWPVRALVRPGADIGVLDAAGAEVVVGRLRDQTTVAEAMADVGTVITTANSALESGAETPEATHLTVAGTRTLIDAAAAAGVDHLVFTSAYGADPASPVPFLAAKGQAESYLLERGLRHTVLAPDLVMEVWVAAVVGEPARSGGAVTIVGRGDRRHAFVAAEDVAAYAVAAATRAVGSAGPTGGPVTGPADGPGEGYYLPVGGPEALTWREVVAIHERVMGRPVRIRTVVPGELVPGVPPHLAATLALLDTYDSAIEMDAVSAAWGITPTPLEAILRRQLDLVYS